MYKLSLSDFYAKYCVIKEKDGTTRKPTKQEIERAKAFEEFYKLMEGKKCVLMRGRTGRIIILTKKK